jgi:uncharacterized protein (AIM24 family)
VLLSAQVYPRIITGIPSVSLSNEHPRRIKVREFIKRTSQKDKGQGKFELESEYLLEVNLKDLVWTKMGSMIAYLGNIKFTREGMLEHGVTKLLKQAVTNEGLKLTKAEGQGKLYLARKYISNPAKAAVQFPAFQ